MYKLKTRSSAKKRFHIVTNKKIFRRKAFKGHFLEKKSATRKKALSLPTNTSRSDLPSVCAMLPYIS